MAEKLVCEVRAGLARGAAGPTAPAALTALEVWKPAPTSGAFAFALGALAAGVPADQIRVRSNVGTCWREKGLFKHHARHVKGVPDCQLSEVGTWALEGVAPPVVHAGLGVGPADAQRWTRYATGLGTPQWCQSWLDGWVFGRGLVGQPVRAAWVARRLPGGWWTVLGGRNPSGASESAPPDPPEVEVQLWSHEGKTWGSHPALTCPETEDAHEVGCALVVLGYTVRLAYRSGVHRHPLEPVGWAGDYALAVPVNAEAWARLAGQMPSRGQRLAETSGRLWQQCQDWQAQALPWRLLSKGLGAEGARALLRVWSRVQRYRAGAAGQGGLMLQRSIDGQRWQVVSVLEGDR